jgi:RNA polymerase sigma-70 factor, ECF subfamily
MNIAAVISSLPPAGPWLIPDLASRLGTANAGRHVDNSRLSDLIEAMAARRDKGAFAGLFSHFAPRLKAFGIRQGVDAATAEELVQETMLSVWRKAGTYDRRRANASTWIFTILRNKRIDMLRRQSRPEVDLDSMGELASDASSADDDHHAAQAGEIIRQAMIELPEEQVEVLKKAFFEDKPHSVIAEELELPLGTVKSRIRLALARLRLVLPEGQL